jgi:hypothetical protein
VGNKLEGLKLDGFELKVTLDEKLFAQCGDKQSLADRYAKDKDLQTKFFWRFNAEKGAAAIPEVKDCYVCSLVKEIKWVDKPHPDVRIDGYRLIWRGFGIIYLGEITVGLKSRQLTIVRVELGEQEDAAAGPAPTPSPTAPKAKLRALTAASVPDNFGSVGGGSVGDGVGTMP